MRTVPEPANRLADGVVVEAQIRGHLLGAPILRLEAEVVLTPARAVAESAVLPPRQPRAMVVEPAPAAYPSVPAGSRGLAEARSLIAQSEQSLRQIDTEA